MSRSVSIASLLPADVASALRPHLGAPPRDAADLRATVATYRAKVREAGEAPGAVANVEVSDRIAERLDEMIGAAHAMDERQRDLLQAAVLYYAADDDEESDVDSPMGFDDDALVLDAVGLAIARLAMASRRA